MESQEPVVKPVVLTNYFNFTLVIHQVSFPEDVRNIFKVSNRLSGHWTGVNLLCVVVMCFKLNYI